MLESIADVALPRGDHLVTRCPLQLSIRHGKTECARVSYGGLTEPKQIAFEDIPAEIEAATAKLAGTHKGIVDELITLEVTRPDAPDLSLIDLPGIVRTPVGEN